MGELFHMHQRNQSLLRLTEDDNLGRLTDILSHFWLPPHEMATEIEQLLQSWPGCGHFKVIVSGETKNVSLYVIDPEEVLVFMPEASIAENVLLQEVYGADSLPAQCNWHIFPSDAQLLKRLSLPKVLLANPCVIENFPIPRLCLSIGLLASYLRKHQKADVRIIDMQLNATVEQILQEAVQFQPQILGLSISYGQKWVALSILEEIYRIKRQGLINSLVVLGNIIPASFPDEFLDLYPDLVVSNREGELALLGLVEHVNNERDLSTVPAIVYRDASGKSIYTPGGSVPMESIPLPALDTIQSLAHRRGALTLELSRGCQWNVCTFCPREHKSHNWKTFTTQQVLEQFHYLRVVSERFSITPHVFLADEEFIGGANDGLETERIAEIAKGLLSDQHGMSFDAAARADQVYSPKMDRDWHIKRIEMWHLCHQAGLDRLFMGIESGSDSQLRRYGKGIRAEQSVMAIRILSALGIPLRFGFIMYDQLMIGLSEMKENIAFLERTDAFMQKLDVEQYGYSELLDLLVNDKDFVREHSANKPIHAGISYMLASMEVLLNSRYRFMLEHAERRYGKTLLLDQGLPDTNMGRFRVTFLDDLVGDISVSSQKWIDRHFGLAYSVKSLYKVALRDERQYLMDWMIAYRRISMMLLKALVYIFDEVEDASMLSGISLVYPSTTRLISQIEDLRLAARSVSPDDRKYLIEACLDLFDPIVGQENATLRMLLSAGKLTDTLDNQLYRILESWNEKAGHWSLINAPVLSS